MRDPRDAARQFEALAAWGNLHIVRPLKGGNRGGAVLVHGTTPDAGNGAALFVAKPTTRTAEAVAWAARIQQHAREAGFEVPGYRRSLHDRFVEGGFTLEAYVEGRPASSAERAVALPELSFYHEATRGIRPQTGAPPPARRTGCNRAGSRLRR